jgi:hypothetical protein
MIWAEAAREHAWKLFVDWPQQMALTPDEEFFVRIARAVPAARHELAGVVRAHPLPEMMVARLGDMEIDCLLAARITARLTQLHDWLCDCPAVLGQISAAPVTAGTGEAHVETARGELRHRLELTGGMIAAYTIEAPTDDHFVPHGEVARWLTKLHGQLPNAAKIQAQRLAMVFDPCVPWECVIQGSGYS